jgi:hypothetical protein
MVFAMMDAGEPKAAADDAPLLDEEGAPNTGMDAAPAFRVSS